MRRLEKPHSLSYQQKMFTCLRSTTCVNGLLRQYFPKGTDLSVHSPARLLQVATEFNARPRKTLGGITPAKAMQRLLFDPESPIVATTA